MAAMSKSNSRLNLLLTPPPSPKAVMKEGPPSMLQMQELIADSDTIISLLDIKGKELIIVEVDE